MSRAEWFYNSLISITAKPLNNHLQQVMVKSSANNWVNLYAIFTGVNLRLRHQ